MSFYNRLCFSNLDNEYNEPNQLKQRTILCCKCLESKTTFVNKLN